MKSTLVLVILFCAILVSGCISSSSDTNQNDSQVFPPYNNSNINCTPDWSCTNWGSCTNSLETRVCADQNNCNSAYNKPEEQQSCSNANCVPSWSCLDWNSCVNGSQTRVCADQNNCNNTYDKPSEQQTCAGPDEQLLREAAAYSNNFSSSDSVASITDIEFNKIIQKYQKIIDQYPGSSLADDAQYLVGNLYIHRYTYSQIKDASLLNQAQLAYQKVVNNYPSAYLDNITLETVDWHFFQPMVHTTTYDVKDSSRTAAMAQATLAFQVKYVTGDYSAAVNDYQKVIDNYPTERKLVATAYMLKGNIYEVNLHQYNEAATSYRRVIDNYPEYDCMAWEAYTRIGAMMQTLNFGDAALIDTYAAELASKKSAQDYFWESNGCARDRRWGQTHLKIYIDSTADSTEKQTIIDAIDSWLAIPSDTHLTYELTDYSLACGLPETLNDPNIADIWIKFQEAPEWGITIMSISSDASTSWVRISFDRTKASGDFRHVALHELGHAFGLAHSFNRNDVMGIAGSPSQLSTRDINTFKELYK